MSLFGKGERFSCPKNSKATLVISVAHFPGPGTHRKVLLSKGKDLKLSVDVKSPRDVKTIDLCKSPTRLQGKIAGIDANDIEAAIEAYKGSILSVKKQNEKKMKELMSIEQKAQGNEKLEGRPTYTGISQYD